MPQFSICLRNLPPVRISDKLPEPGADLAGLQRLTGGTLTPENGAGDVELAMPDENRPRLEFDADSGTFRRRQRPPAALETRVRLWRLSWLLAVLARILRGERLLLLHGCLLEKGSGGIVLCGPSGMGKTTTARRWQAAGGDCPADDMILLEYGDGGLYAHPLPTWSRCLEGVSGEYFPVERAIPLTGVLALGRDEEREHAGPVPEFRFLSAVYASCVLFNLPLLKGLTPEHRERAIGAMKSWALLLTEQFPPRMLFANLQGNLRETLAAEFPRERGEKK